MTNHAFIESILLEADGPQVVLARDVVGTLYLGLLAVRNGDGDQFLTVAVSKERLADVLAGTVGLRAALERPETGETFLCPFGRIDDQPAFRLQRVSTLEPKWLPAPDFTLSEFLDEDHSTEMLAEAALRRRPLVTLVMDPPEAYVEAKVDADRLSEGLRVFQNLVRHAYTKASATVSQEWKRLFGDEGTSTLQVYALSEGSFQVHLQGKHPPDFGGMSAVGLGLNKIDELTAHLDDPSRTLEIVKDNRGHVISAYQALLKFILESHTPIQYSWVDLETGQTRRRKISEEAAERIYEVLTSRQDLGREEMVHVGAFSKVDEKLGTWTLKTEGVDVRGFLAEGVGNLLYGVTIGSKLYSLHCEEILEERAGTGRQQKKLLLKRLQPVRNQSPDDPGPV